MSIIFSIGSYGGFYWHLGNSFRLCLGWVAITVILIDIDFVLEAATRQAVERQRQNEPLSDDMDWSEQH